MFEAEKTDGGEALYLHVVVSVEGLAANRTREVGRANEDLRGGGNPILASGELAYARESKRITITTTSSFLALLVFTH